MGPPDKPVFASPALNRLGGLGNRSGSTGCGPRGLGSVGIRAILLFSGRWRFGAPCHGLEPHGVGHARAIESGHARGLVGRCRLRSSHAIRSLSLLLGSPIFQLGRRYSLDDRSDAGERIILHARGDPSLAQEQHPYRHRHGARPVNGRRHELGCFTGAALGRARASVAILNRLRRHDRGDDVGNALCLRLHGSAPTSPPRRSERPAF